LKGEAKWDLYVCILKYGQDHILSNILESVEFDISTISREEPVTIKMNDMMFKHYKNK